jgi:hypothetical protein
MLRSWDHHQGVHIEVTLHKTEEAMYIHIKKICTPSSVHIHAGNLQNIAYLGSITVQIFYIVTDQLCVF